MGRGAVLSGRGGAPRAGKLRLTFDENDGFFDHVVPPYPPASSAWGLSTADVSKDLYKGGGGYAAGPYGLGPRVPMIVV